MAKLRWSLQAADDLNEACEYIARDSEHYARLFAQQVTAILKSMAKEKLLLMYFLQHARRARRNRSR